MRAPSPALEMSGGQREMLEVLARSQTAAHREVLRAKALLLAGQGVATTRIAQEIGAGPGTVTSWRARFADEGLAKFGMVWPGRGVKSTIPQSVIDETLDLTMNSKPDGETHWSCRTMAAKVGVSKDTVQRVCGAEFEAASGAYKLSNDPHFEEKLIDVIGLYLDPPERGGGVHG